MTRTGRSQQVRRPVTVLAMAAVAAAGATVGVLASGVTASTASPGRVPALTAHAAAASSATVTVTGNGAVTGTPDTLTLQMGVSVSASDAAAALDRSSTELSALEKVFTSAGVASKDLQTSALELQPNYDNAGTITGYQADDELTVTLRNLSQAGTVIDAAAHAAGNDVRIDGIDFSIGNTAPLLAQARAQAVHDAQSAASTIAKAAGTTLGPIVSISDESESVPPPLPYAGASGAAAAAPLKSVQVPVQSGSQQVTAQVQIVYGLGS